MKFSEIVFGVILLLVGGYFLLLSPVELLIMKGIAMTVVIGVPALAFFAGKLVGINFKHDTPHRLLKVSIVCVFGAFVFAVVGTMFGGDVTTPPLTYIFQALAFGGFAVGCLTFFMESSRRTYLKKCSRKSIVPILMLALLVAASACGGQEPAQQQEQQAPAQPQQPDVPKQLAPSQEDQQRAASPVQQPVPEPTEEEMTKKWRDEKGVPTLDSINIESVRQLMDTVMEKDPYRENFTIDGHVKENENGVDTLYVVQLIARENRYLESVFNAMPILQRREVVQQAANIVASHAVSYMHQNDMRAWLVNYDWKRDIEPVNPDWYQGTEWPENRFEPVEPTLPGTGANEGFVKDPKAKGFKISKVDLWWRMFWKRRGEIIFNAAKTSVAAELTKKR